jgi:hypothetical protein
MAHYLLAFKHVVGILDEPLEVVEIVEQDENYSLHFDLEDL